MTTTNKTAHHVFNFSPKENGGESLILKSTLILDPGNSEPYLVQELTLQSYCNAATFHLQGIQLTPSNLRKLADELALFLNKPELK